MKSLSFEQVAESFHPLIVSMIQKHHIYKEQEEYYQLALINLWKAYQKFDESKGSFSAYAYSTVRGTILMELKTSVKRDEREALTEDTLLVTHPDDSLPVALQSSIIHEMIEHLTPREKIYILEYLLGGYSYRELADKYGVSTGAVKNWGKTARKKLKETLSHS